MTEGYSSNNDSAYTNMDFISGLAWSLYKCAGLWLAVFGATTTGRPLGTIRND